MKDYEQSDSAADVEVERDCGKPLLVDWTDSEWFQVWLKLARHEEAQAA
jgi:hypothetical protein